ncbi:MAG TPA: type I-B CRISPR-associated endonuclease Cas1 [Syntrophothermus lipocalidus]|nr:type I-B CRISPR-associated endonuclease Cas1 [Syntrophothermus lipocalidus]
MKKTIYVTTAGQLKREQNTLCLVTEEGKRFLPVEDISDILIFGELDLNKRLLEFLSEKKIILHFYNHYGYYVGSYYPREHLNSGYMTVRQAQCYLDYARRLELARAFAEGAYANIRQVLMYYLRRGKDVSAALGKIDNLASSIGAASSIEELMAIEGNIRDHYYGCFDAILNNPDFCFQYRSRRPPANQLNALISFGNSLLYTTVLSEIYRTHLDPRIGFLHASNFRRFTLNLDIAEIFKPIIVDRVIFTLVGRNMLSSKDFISKLNGIVLSEAGRNTFIREYENKMATTVQHKELGRNVSYRRLIRMELYKLEKHLMEEREFKAYTARW